MIYFYHLIQEYQHGFLQGKSCVTLLGKKTNLLEAPDYIGKCPDKRGQVDLY